MRTVTFQSVYEQVMRLCALDPDDATFTAARQEMVADCITRRVREGWEYAAWPELCVVEERTPVSGLVAYDQSGQTVMGEVFGVWDKDFRAYPETSRQYAFEPDANGIRILETTGSTVWVHFRRVPARFTRAAYSALTTYTLGDIMYYATNAECYQATEDGTGAETWTLISFPYVLETFVVLAAASDVLRDAGQHEKAAELEARAAKAIEDQYDKTFGQQQQGRRMGVKVE